jgi:hypothetical protein
VVAISGNHSDSRERNLDTIVGFPPKSIIMNTLFDEGFTDDDSYMPVPGGLDPYGGRNHGLDGMSMLQTAYNPKSVRECEG